MSLKLFLKNMSKASNVELLNFYSLVEVPFKYAHKEVLFSISILYFKSQSAIKSSSFPRLFISKKDDDTGIVNVSS